jgi:hypothetical protein
MQRANTRAAAIGATALLAAACSGSTTRHLDPAQVAMTDKMMAAYDDGELTLYESYMAVNLPVIKPTADQMKMLPKAVQPFDHAPWVTTHDVHYQLTFTLANMDRMDPKGEPGNKTHTVEVLVDPWNEFGKYVPGVSGMGDNKQPNLSGYDEAYDVPSIGSGRPSRVQHTITFDDMDELATDFATVINILTKVKATPAMNGEPGDDPRVALVNHAFELQNRHGSDPFTDGYTPAVIPALIGFNLGLRTNEKANLVLEYSVEIVDDDGDRIVQEGSSDPTLVAGGRTFSLGGG